MEHYCLIGKSDMRDFTPWWESHLPAYLLVCCLEGEAELTLLFKPHAFKQGMIAFISPDMFPDFVYRSADFMAFYCLYERDFAEESLYDIPNSFFNGIYSKPMIQAGAGMGAWMELLCQVNKDSGNPYRKSILKDTLHAIVLDCYHKWQQQYGNLEVKDERTSAESICMKFYDLIFDHFREHRNTAFYADKLCITPCYLAMVVRQVAQESPKQVIDRQVTLEMKYMLRNTTMTAEQIARSLHFPDTSYMCRFFRRQTGLSLSEYRKRQTS